MRWHPAVEAAIVMMVCCNATQADWTTGSTDSAMAGIPREKCICMMAICEWLNVYQQEILHERE